MTATPSPIPRHQLHRVHEALADTRVVLIAGPRQAGKSTLAQIALSGRPDATILTLDEEATRRAAEEDPAGFVQHDGVLLIDEVQRVPELLLAIKAVVDRDTRPGRFLLTGSANVLQLPRVADTLPGRIEIIDLWPFSQGELAGDRLERFIDRAFERWSGVRISNAPERREYIERAVRGGFPEVVARENPRRRAAWFDSYVRTLIGRDLRQIAEIQRGEDATRLLRLIAARSGQLLSVNELARDAAMPVATVRRYLHHLETAYIVTVVPAWSNNRTTRAVHAPKLFVTDTGLLSFLINADAKALAAPGGNAGPLLETFVQSEIRKQLSNAADRPSMFHYRTRDGVEVDLVLEAADGRLVGIEVKASATVRAGDFAGLHHLAERTGDKFRCGLVVYTGTETLPFGDHMRAVPLSAIWQA